MTSGDDNGQGQGQAQARQRLDRRRLVLSVLVSLLLLVLSLFVPAGTLAWWNGWLFLVVLIGVSAIAGVYAVRANPELLFARSRFHKGTKRWDLILLSVLLPAIAVIVPVAALDAGRLHGFPVPWWVLGFGYVLLIVGIAIMTWAQVVNRFFEPGVRIQSDRGQTVIDTGPYAFVRHPGYVGACLMFPGMALALGSLWALIPASLASALLILRTRWEDQTLQTELVGYEEYTKRVRFRLIPGVW